MNHWRTDSWQQDGWTRVQYTCTKCGLRFEYFQAGVSSKWLISRREEHEKECWEPEPRCAFVLHPDAVPVLRCGLAAGHPEGPQYDWFTDYNGHVIER
jgi:hypothetical protein